MKTALKTQLKTQIPSVCKSYNRVLEKEISLVNNKFYQKLFVLLISFLTILIFPDSPRKLENICASYNSRNTCNVW